MILFEITKVIANTFEVAITKVITDTVEARGPQPVPDGYRRLPRRRRQRIRLPGCPRLS